MVYCTALYCGVLYWTVVWCTALYNGVLYCTVLWCTVCVYVRWWRDYWTSRASSGRDTSTLLMSVMITMMFIHSRVSHLSINPYISTSHEISRLLLGQSRSSFQSAWCGILVTPSCLASVSVVIYLLGGCYPLAVLVHDGNQHHWYSRADPPHPDRPPFTNPGSTHADTLCLTTFCGQWSTMT